jgi:hypothetical protein
MPPLRTTPPAKAIKTERTHEENQERLADPKPPCCDLADPMPEHTLLHQGEAIEA